MDDTQAGARPSQVTMAGWMAVAGSALLVLTIMDTMSQIRSLEMQTSVEEFLSAPPGDGLGLTVSEVIELLRGAMMVAGAAAAAATVLAVYVLRRNNAARVGFTVAAAAILLTAPAAGSFLPILIAVAASMLWTRPARDWFAGRAPAAVPAGARGAASQRFVMSERDPRPGDEPGEDQPTSPGQAPWPRVPESGGSAPGQTPPPTQGFGSPHSSSPSQPPHSPQPQQPWPGQGEQGYGAPQAGHPYGGPQAGNPNGTGQPYPPVYGYPGGYGQPAPYGFGQGDRRPLSVTIAAVLTWVFAGLTALAYVVVAGMLLVSKDRLINLVEQDPQLSRLDITTNELLAALWVMSAVVLFWSLAAIVLAAFAFRRQRWARITLAVSAGVAALVSLLAFPVGVVHMIAAGAVVVLLFIGGANEWYAGRPPRGFASYPGPRAPHEERPEPPKNVW